jgi:peptidoglycan L-alanyl-D-glutamate endopeptidase CwlK
MSSPLFKVDILFVQRLLSSAGLYKGPLDGKFNQALHDAEDAFDAFYVGGQTKYGSFDPRSESVISGLLPKAQVIARRFLANAAKAPFTVKLLSGTRTYAEQNALYAQGRTASGRVVTNAKGGQSNHNFGIAWDAGIFVGGVYYEGKNAKEDRAYVDLMNLTKTGMPGLLELGGDWKSIVDKPHYQLPSGKSVSQIAALLQAGKPYV